MKPQGIFQIALSEPTTENLAYMQRAREICAATGIGYMLYNNEDWGRLKNIQLSNIMRIDTCIERPGWLYADNDIEFYEIPDMPCFNIPYFAQKLTGGHLSNCLLSDNGSGLLKMPDTTNKYWVRPWMQSYRDVCGIFDKRFYKHH